jgi:pyruvate dehydrogenase E2 component (dihydrolipoamide acetyltransferase)
MTDIAMPRLSDSMEEGTIISWLVEDGQPVSGGDELVEIETDKAAATHAADSEGILRILAPAGTKCAVGAVIARLEPADVPLGDLPRSPQATSAVATTDPAAPPLPRAPASARETAPYTHSGTGRLATPLARRAAAIHGVQLETITGNGPRGRITHSDVLAAAGVTIPATTSVDALPTATFAIGNGTAAAANSSVETGRGEVTLVFPTRLQQVIAERMTEANDAIPAFQVQTEVNFDQVVALRQSIKDVAGDGPVPSLNDFVVKAAALALRQVPAANGSYSHYGFELHSRINIGVAVAADTALVVPTVFDADTKSLGTIAAETRRLADRVRSAKISPAELSGGTFTVSNLGMYGMTAITPIINPPQAAILGVGAAREVLARVHGEIVEQSQVTLTLSCDHRILYGADAARLLAAIRALLESPLQLAL